MKRQEGINLAHDKVAEAVLHRPRETLVGPDVLCYAELLVCLPGSLRSAHASGSCHCGRYPDGGGRHFSRSSSEKFARGNVHVQLQQQQ